MKKHTKGPWILTGERNSFYINFQAGYKTQITLAVVEPVKQDGVERISIDEAHANAQLIATAPEMLHTLKSVQAQIVEKFLPGKADPFIQSLLIELAKTITKAEVRE